MLKSIAMRMPIRLVLSIVVCLMAFAIPAEAERITFVLTNDIYQMSEQRGQDGKLRGGFARLAAVVKAERARGNPVIVRLRLPSGITHFVVIAGKKGFDYLTRDPGAGAAKGLYPLREFGSKIEALRFYERL